MSSNYLPPDPQGSTSAPISHPPSPPLQRGKACLSCRRRKMKCDGARPICSPCLRGERAEDCEYTDGQHRPRTLALEEDLARLRARVWELENPADVVPPVALHAPYVGSGPGPSSRPVQLQAPTPSFTPHPYPAGRSSGTPGPRPLDFPPDPHVNGQQALSAIAPYAAGIGLFLDIDRLRAQGTHVLPALQTALAVFSVHVTAASDPDHGEGGQAVISRLFSLAQSQHAAALSAVDAEPDPTQLLHVIQTGVLLAYYMQRIGQTVGARYYASGTWSLVTLLKLHQNFHLPLTAADGGQGRRGGSTHPCAFDVATCAKLPPALDGIEAEERVRAFWAVYALDRWLCAVGQGLALSRALDESPGTGMTVPWPDMHGANEARFNVVQHLLNDPGHDFTHDSPSALFAKASVLLGEATSLAASFTADHTVCQAPGFQARFGTLDALLQRCLNAAMTAATALHGQTQGQGQALLTVHLTALAHLALHRAFIATYGPSRRRCLDGALGTMRVLDHIGELGPQAAISPMYAIVWTALCLAMHDEVLRLRARPDGDAARRREEAEMSGAIRKLVGMLGALSQHCPSRFFAAKIEAVLPVLESLSL